MQFGITKVVVAESENFHEENGHNLMARHGVEVVNLDLDETQEDAGATSSKPTHSAGTGIREVGLHHTKFLTLRLP